MRRSTIAAAVALPERARRRVWKAAVILLAREEEGRDNRRSYFVWAQREVERSGWATVVVSDLETSHSVMVHGCG